MLSARTEKFSSIQFSNKIIVPAAILLILLIPIILFANTAKYDSLKLLLNETQDDSLLGEIYIKLGVFTSEHEADKAIDYLEKSLFHFTNADFNLGKARTLNSLGYHYWILGQYSNAIDHYKEALNLYTALNDSVGIGRVSNNLGAVFWGLNDYNSALEYYQKSLQIRRALGNPVDMSIVLNNIGMIYQAWRLYDQAFQFHNEAMELAESVNHNSAVAYSYYNIAQCLEATGKIDEALEYYRIAYDKYRDIGRIGGSTSLVLRGMGDLYYNEQEYVEALYYYRMAAHDASLENNVFREAGARLSMAKTFISIGQMDSALFYSDKVLNTANSYGYDQMIRDSYYLYSDILTHKENYKEALQYYRMATAINDSIFNEEKSSRFTELQIRYNLEKEQQENEILRKNNEIQTLRIYRAYYIRNLSITGALLFLIAFGIVFYQSKNLKRINREKEKEIVERKAAEERIQALLKEKEILLKEVHHRIKNNLNTVRSLLTLQARALTDSEAKEALKNAGHRVQSMSLLYDKLYRSTNIKNISTQKYFKSVVKEIIHVFPQCDQVTIHTEIEDIPLNVQTLSVLGIIVTELITNAMKYGFPGDQKGNINVLFFRKDGFIILNLSNDGLPLSPDFSIEKNTGFGLRLISLLANQLNGVFSIEKNKGTHFIVRFPES